MGRKKIADDKKQVNVTGKVPPELKIKVQELIDIWDSNESAVLKQLLEVALKYLGCFSLEDKFLDQFSALPPDRRDDLLDQVKLLYDKYGKAAKAEVAEPQIENSKIAA